MHLLDRDAGVGTSMKQLGVSYDLLFNTNHEHEISNVHVIALVV